MSRIKRIITVPAIAAATPVTARRGSMMVRGFGGCGHRRGAHWIGGALLVAVALMAFAAPAAWARFAPQSAVDAASGQLYAFGDNGFGQLGSATNNGGHIANPTPTRVALPGATGPVAQIAAGYDHSVAVTSTGQLYAFGDNLYGQLGSATNSGTANANPTPTRVALPGATGVGFAVTQIAAGDGHSLAVTSLGRLYAFGDNYSGQLGSATNNSTTKANPTPSLVALPGATGRVTEVAAGASYSLAVTSTGQLYAFGDNYDGQLGSATHDGTANANPTPTLVALPGATGAVTQVAAGASHSLALTSSGQLYAFGLNDYGQLGNATNNGTGNANPTPTRVALPGASGPVTEIAAGFDHSLAVTSTGQLYAFGLNEYGQLGSATNNGTGNANPTPTLVTLPGATGPVTQIAAGLNHSLAVTSTGQLYAFGNNYSGQLGSATNSGTTNPTPTPVRPALPAGLIAVTVASGSSAYHTLAVLTTAPAATPPGTTPPGTTPPPTAPPPTTPPPTTMPTLSRLRATPSGFSLAGRLVGGRCVKPTNTNRKHKQCTRPIAVKLSYTLNIATTVIFTLTRQEPGRNVNGLCVKVTRKNAQHARCTRLTRIRGAVTHASTAGSNAFTFDGRIGGKTLTPGTYLLAATPTSNGYSGGPQSVTIKLLS